MHVHPFLHGMKTSTINCPLNLGAALVFFLLLQAGARSSDSQVLEAAAEKIVSPYKAVFVSPPVGMPSRDSARGPLLGNGNLGVVISGAPEAQRFWLSKNNFWRMRDGHREGGPRLFGGLEINIPALAGGSYLIEQQLFPATTTARFSKGESTVVMRSLVAATADVLLIELTVEGKPVEVETRMWAAPGRGSKEELGRKNGVLWAAKAFPDEKIPTAAAAALTILGGKPAWPELEPYKEEVIPNPPPKHPPPPTPKSQPGPKFTLQPGEKVSLLVEVQSSFDARNPLAAVQESAAGMNADLISKLLAAHTQWWREFWSKSLIEIGDPLLEQRYYLSNYLLGCTSRNTDFPPGLFGVWVTDDDPRWAGDYHLNYNYQAAFYGLYSSNHLEQAATYHAPVLAFMERGRFYAKKLLGLRGVYYPVGIGPMGIEPSLRANLNNAAYQEGGCFMGQKCNAAYAVTPMSMHWYHSYDPNYAKVVYPFVLEVASFWEDYLKFEEDRYVIENDSIQENSGPDFNSIMSLGLVRNVFETVLDMSIELDADKERQEKWRHILQHLSTFPTLAKDKATVFRDSEKGTEWSADNTCSLQHIYPAGALGPDSDPQLLEISRNTIRIMNRWKDANGMSSIYPAAARVGYDPAIILQELRDMIQTKGGINGLTTSTPEAVENCSIVPNTINEMLCMSHGHVLRLFQTWPKDKDARFSNLRAWGAFLVSAELKGGEVQYVDIVSERGRKCTIQNPWPGHDVKITRDDGKTEMASGTRFTLDTRVHEKLRIAK